MSTTRLEAFSDGVFAIIITIMVLELKVPHHDTLEELLAQWPIFLSYALSYVMVAEYWMNHHLMFHMVKRVNNRILWSNLLLLFTLSLIPLFTAFMGENHFSAFSTAAYSAYMLVCALTFNVWFWALSHHLGADTHEQQCLRRAGLIKSFVAIGVYALAIPLAFCSPMLALAMNVCVASLYFLPTSWLEHKPKG